MERLVKKYEQRYKKAQEALAQWNTLQGRLVRLFANAAAVIQRMPVLLVGDNYGALEEIEGMTRDLPAKQAESLERILMAMRETLVEFEAVCRALEKLSRDGNNLLKTERPKPTPQQARHRSGSRASLDDCVNGLKDLSTMHADEYALKVDLISTLTYDTSPNDAVALQTVLAEQPNIPPDEVQAIFDLIFAGGST